MSPKEVTEAETQEVVDQAKPQPSEDHPPPDLIQKGQNYGMAVGSLPW